MSTDTIHISPHIQRDCVFLNKRRGEICANVSSNPMLSNIISILHDADRIDQMNSIPDNNICFIDKKVIPKNSSGIQLIIYKGNEIKHICIQKKYQKICYGYFKLRHFPSFIEQHIKDWLLEQEWYVPHAYTIKYIIDKVLNSQIPQAIYTHLNETVDILNEGL